MPDLSTRRQHEAAIVAALILLFDDYRLHPETFDPATFEDRLLSSLSGKLAAVYAEAGSGFAAGLGAAVGPEVVDANARKWETAFLPVLVATIAATTDPLAPGSFAPSRAEMIAATEVTRAITASEMAIAGYLTTVAPELGIRPLKPIWYTAVDERVCPVCEPLHGLGQENWRLAAPDGPPAHPNCRCYLTWE